MVTTHTIRDSVSWFSAIKHSWRTALRIDRSQITAIPAIRSTIGFVLPLAIGVATGHVIEGVSMAGGAASLGVVGLTYTYHARMRVMLLACFGVALSAFVGAITSRIDWLAILVAGIWGVGAGLLVAISQPAMVIGLQSTVALIILSHFPLDPAHAALQAALMFAGALFQTVLALVPVPWRRTAPERAALAALYQSLADYAHDPANEESGQEVRNALVQAQSTLADGAMRSQAGKAFMALLDEAERIRLSFIALTRLRQNLAVDTAPLTSSAIDLTQIRQATAEELERIARELVPEHSITNLTNHMGRNRHNQPQQQMKQSLSELRQHISLAGEDETMRQMLAYYDMLREQLHSAKKLAKSWKHTRNTQKHLSVQANFPRQSHLRIHDAAAILRANLTLRSVAFRHAIRLGITLALATALYRDLPLLLQRGYWIPLSALLVLKPDFSTTFARGAARSLGTILGAVLTTLLLSSLAPTKELLVILDAIMAYIAFSVLFANYALFSAFVTMEVVFLLTFVTPQPLMTAVDRAVDTAIGSILALLIYALWPTWERSQVPGNLADRLEALRHYFATVMEAYANPANFDDIAIQSRRMESRLGRSNADASVGRSLQEPEPHRFDTDLAQGLLAAADSISRSVLSLEAYLMDNPARHALPAVRAFSSSVDEALRLLALALRDGQPVIVFPDLQQAMHKLEHGGTLSKHNVARADLRFVIAEARRIIRNINTMKHLLATKKEDENVVR